MKKGVIALLILIAVVFISGCAGKGALPAAFSGMLYSYTIPDPSGANGPFTCAVAAGSVIPSGLSFQGCILSGTAPTLLGVTEEVFSFQFTITGSDGKTYGPFDASLPVSVAPLEFLPPELPDAAIGQRYLFSFCSVPSTLDCAQSYYVIGGAGAPYTFSATGLSLGLFLSPGGELSGTIPEGTQDGDKTFRVCAIDSSRVEDCKDVKVTIKKLEVREYKVNLRATQVYHGERNVYYYEQDGGATRAYEDGSLAWEMNDVVITLTSPGSYELFTSDDYEVSIDEYGSASADNFSKKQFPVKAAGTAATSYEFSIPENGKCRAESVSGNYDFAVPMTLKVDFSGKLILDIDEDYWKFNPELDRGDESQVSCESGITDYILKGMMRGLVNDAGLGYIMFEGDGGTKTGGDDDPNVYTYAFGASHGGTNSFDWTVTVERIK